MGEPWTRFCRLGARAIRRELIQIGDVIYLGLQSGTTARDESLAQHSEIFTPYVKLPSCAIAQSALPSPSARPSVVFFKKNVQRSERSDQRRFCVLGGLHGAVHRSLGCLRITVVHP